MLIHCSLFYVSFSLSIWIVSQQININCVIWLNASAHESNAIYPEKEKKHTRRCYGIINVNGNSHTETHCLYSFKRVLYTLSLFVACLDEEIFSETILINKVRKTFRSSFNQHARLSIMIIFFFYFGTKYFESFNNSSLNYSIQSTEEKKTYFSTKVYSTDFGCKD